MASDSAMVEVRHSSRGEGIRFLFAALGFWLVGCALLIYLCGNRISALSYTDPDDELRLVEVHDWLNGQSWFDVTQYRMNLPAGGPMHWSRLVDLPLAFVIRVTEPFIGYDKAQLIASVIVPLITMGIMMLLVGLIAKRLGGMRAGLLAMPLLFISVMPMTQVLPLRVDHHGWGIVLSLLAVLALLDNNSRWASLIAALSIALALQISLEHLPFTVAIGVMLAVRWAWKPIEKYRDQLIIFVSGLWIFEVLLYLIAHGFDARIFCDAVSPSHLACFAITGAGIAILQRIEINSRAIRFAGLTIIAALAAATLLSLAPRCGIGTFELEPITRTLWYEKILEGLPIWHQNTLVASLIIITPLIGIILSAWRITLTSGQDHGSWLVYIILFVAATAVGAMVARAGALANALAVPVIAYFFVSVLRRVQALSLSIARVSAGVAVIIIFTLIPIAPLFLAAALEGYSQNKENHYKYNCDKFDNIKYLNRMNKSNLLVPLDIGPEILLHTHHSIVASGHHRNHAAMADVIIAFTGSDDVAHNIILRRSIDYVVMCPNYPEVIRYEKYSPNGFGAHLAHDRPPSWLKLLKNPGREIRVWKVVR